MYKFIELQYLLGKIDATQVRSYAPKWIIKKQAEEIISKKKEE